MEIEERVFIWAAILAWPAVYMVVKRFLRHGRASLASSVLFTGLGLSAVLYALGRGPRWFIVTIILVAVIRDVSVRRSLSHGEAHE